jgi:hypothetical protein
VVSLEEMETMMTATATAMDPDVLATLLLPQKFAIPRLFNVFHAVNPRKLHL